jgi:hypothetical protein
MASGEQLSELIEGFFSAQEKDSRQTVIEGKLDRVESYLTANHWTLARHLQYYGLALRSLKKEQPSAPRIGGKRARRSGNVNAAWGEALAALTAFQGKLKTVGFNCGNFGSSASLRNFALGQVVKASWRYPRAIIALFLVDEALQRDDRALFGLRMRDRLPECEKDFLARFRRDYLDGKNECPLQGSPAEASDTRRQPAGSSTPALLSGVRVVSDLPRIQSFMRDTFAVDQIAEESFRRYFDTFRAGPKRYLHMICFRGQKSRASSLVVSFLAIIPPESNELAEYSFKHFYQIGKTDKPRISQGLVLPLTGGVYFVGGQQGYEQRTSTFITLKIIALPWRALRARDLVLPGLLMSANREDQHLVGKIALRPTGVTRHDHASIGLRHISEVEEHLSSLAEGDSADSFGAKEQVGKDIAGQAARIAELTNNQSREWDLLDVYRDSQGNELDRPAFEGQIQRAFGRPAEHRYRDGRNRTFRFPDSLWFGPITTDR